MSLSLACCDAIATMRQTRHGDCLRPSCTCYCHGPGRPDTVAHRLTERTVPRNVTRTTALPPRQRNLGGHRAGAVFDEQGRRACPQCGEAFTRKPGPGRYPDRCESCARVATGT